MWLKREIRCAAGLVSLTLLMGCSNAHDKAYDNAELPETIQVAIVDLIGLGMVPGALLNAAHQHPGRCCRDERDSYTIETLDFPKNAEEIMAVLDDDASLYTIALPDPTDTALIRPLFGNKLRHHVMDRPQRGCKVVSGVRDGVLRAGVISHIVSIRNKEVEYENLDRDAIELCLVSAALLLHGFPEAEAMDHDAYSEKNYGFGGDTKPDFEKIHAREAELFAERQD